MDKKGKGNNKSKKNEYDKSLQYAVTAALNYGEIESQPERVSNI